MPDSIYLARASQPDGPRFQRIIFGTSTPLSAPADRAGADWKVTGKPGVIRVKILVDENDVRRSSNWRAKIKQRIEVASKVLEYYCHTRLEVQSYDRWVIDDDVADFEQALTQFEKTVRTDDTDIALGFTSQFALDRKMSHAGGIRGPLRSHILIRDHGLRVSDKGRLEFLLHELGHFFGAAHSPNGNSLMRPVLGDGKANRRDFPLAYDAYNALAMNIFAEQWRRRGVRGIASLEGEARHQLADIYSAMSRLYTSDDTALTLILQVGGSPEYAARALGASIVRVARANERRAATGGKPFEDDDLMAIYVRAAAVFAGKLPKQYARQTFLLGLGVSLDRQNVIGRFSPVARRIESAESAGARQERLRVLGRPTVRGRADLTQHFLASSVLTMTVGTRQAEMAGLLKELADSRGGTGFSSADVTANLAGVEFAKAVLNNELSLQEIARNFHPTLYVPTVVDLEEGLAWEDLVKQFGQPGSEKFQSQLARLRNRVLQTTGFRQLADRKKAGRAPTGDTKNVFGIYENRPERLYEGPPTPSRKSASR
ncbi:MAG: M12 family metallo-peptidase, partial [Pirellulales bacterium]